MLGSKRILITLRFGEILHSFSFLRLKDLVMIPKSQLLWTRLDSSRPNCAGHSGPRPRAVLVCKGILAVAAAPGERRKERGREGRKDGQNGRREDNPGMSSLYLFLSPVFCVGCPIWIRSDGSGRAPRMLKVWNAIELISHLCFATDKH